MTRGGSWFPGTRKRYNVANIITNVILHSQQQQTFNCGGEKRRTYMRHIQLRWSSTAVITKEYSAACVRDVQQSRDCCYHPIILFRIIKVWIALNYFYMTPIHTVGPVAQSV